MTSYYTLLLIVTAAVLFWIVRYFIERSKHHVVTLFKTALKEENTGRYEAAIKQYEIALNEAQKNGFSKSLQVVISEKLRVLHAITEYQKEMCLDSRVYKMVKQAEL